MILVDTSVWIDHLRHGDSRLVAELESTMVAVHPLVIGELACGNLTKRSEVIGLLQNLPQAAEATHTEALRFIDRNGLMGRGIGYMDVHLLASAALGGDTLLWTKDNRLRAVARALELAFVP